MAAALPHDDVGEGAAVVLLHAGVADRRMWSEHLQPLAQAGFRALAVDLPGFGEAAPSPIEEAPWNDVLQTLDALALERAALVGNSFGAAVALRVAAVAPARVSALVLASAPAPGLLPSPELQAAWEAEEEALERGDFDAAVEAVVDTWTLPEASPQLRTRLAEMQRRAFELQRDAQAPEGPDPLEDAIAPLERITTPALVLAGEHDMPDFREGAEAIASALPAATSTTLAGAGHLAPLEQPQAFRRVVLEFLAAHAAAQQATPGAG